MFDGRYLRAYVELVRPFTSFPPFLAILFGSLAGAFATGSEIDIITLIYAGLAMTFAQIFGQVTNQLADPLELDKINNKERVLVRGALPRAEVELIAFMFMLGSLLLAFAVHMLYTTFVCLTILSALFYNYEPIRLKKRFMLNNLILAFSRGLVPMLAAWSVFSPLTAEAWIYAGGLFIWVFGWQTTKDIPDVEGDKRFGIKTLPVVWGVEKSIKFIAATTLAFVFYHVFAALHTGCKGFLLIAVVVGAFGIRGLKMITKESFTENTFGWVAFYLGIVLYYILVWLLAVI